MLLYLLKRLLMMIPTLIGITLVCFLIINMAPGGPVEQAIQKIRFSGSGDVTASGASNNNMGVSEDVIEALKKQYGFDKPVHVRYWLWVTNILKLDFGESFSAEEPVLDVIKSKLPVSLQFGIISLIFTYLISIPLGVIKAVRKDTAFDIVSTVVLVVMYSVPALMLGILLITFFAGGSFWDIFPMAGMMSDNYDELSTLAKIKDRIYHFILPMTCYMIGSFTILTMLMKNSLLDVIKLDYVRTARAKGLSEKVVIYKHALRNALIPIVTGLSGILAFFLAGSVIIEQIFSLDGIGLLAYNSALDRDFNVLMAIIFISSLVMVFGRIISDLLYLVVDPRIDFN